MDLVSYYLISVCSLSMCCIFVIYNFRLYVQSTPIIRDVSEGIWHSRIGSSLARINSLISSLSILVSELGSNISEWSREGTGGVGVGVLVPLIVTVGKTSEPKDDSACRFTIID